MALKTAMLVFFGLMVCQIGGLTLNRHQLVEYPRQYGLMADNKVFVRIYGRNHELIECPAGSAFNYAKSRCQRLEDVVPIEAQYLPENCKPDFCGVVPDPMNCRAFINCRNGYGYVQKCATILTFNNATKECDYPEVSNCCEYFEKDSSKIVM